MKKKYLYILIALAVLAIGFFLYKRHKKTTKVQEDAEPASEPTPVETPQENKNEETEPAVTTETPKTAPKRKAQTQENDEPVSTEDVKPAKNRVPRYGQRVITAVPQKPSGKILIIDGKH